MHPRFLQFIDRLSDRPHQDRQAIGFSVALTLTALLVVGRFTLFPVSVTDTASTPHVASIGETFSLVTEDLAAQTASIQAELKKFVGDPESPVDVASSEKPAAVPLMPNGSSAVSVPTDEWSPSEDGYFYEYPTGAR